jgi:hypothetical protein
LGCVDKFEGHAWVWWGSFINVLACNSVEIVF